MTDHGNDDLDWLYRRGAYVGEPEWEPVRVQRGPVYSGQQFMPPLPTQSPASPSPGASRRRRRRPIRKTLTLVAAVTLVYLVMVPAFAWSLGQRVDATPDGERPPPQPGSLYLLAGSDARDLAESSKQGASGNGTPVRSRADTIMLLYVPSRGRPALVSVPRDSYLTIPGHGQNKVNAAYAIGGPKLLVNTLEQRTGLRIDGYAEVGFEGFVNVIDALGGIEMCPPKAIKDRDSHLDIPAGCQHFDGDTALGYVRMRKSDPEGDVGRVRRQREMVSAVASKAASPASFVDPVRYLRLNQSVANAIATSTDTGVLDVSKLVVGMTQLSGSDALTITVPISNADARTQAGSSVLWDDEEADALFDEIAQGDTSKLDRFKK